MHADQIRRLVHEELPRVIEIRHDIHRHPELGYQEHRTADLIKNELASLGIEFVGGLARGTGILAHLPATNGHQGTPIALRADMDALPVTERTGVPYASETPGVMHACGHDGHTANLLGVARVLSRIEERPNPITFIFQPAEEGGAGGRAMCDDGVLNGTVLGPPIERIYGLHGWPQLQLGQVGTRPGPLLAATDMFDVTIRGVQSHGAYPHQGEDPIVAAAACINALQSIVSRDVRPVEPALITVGQINAGTAENIIPETCWMKGTVRSLTHDTRQLLNHRFHEVMRHTAESFRCVAEIEWHDGYPVCHNAPDLVDGFFKTARAMIGDERVIHVEQPTLGGEDFAYYGQHVPACFFILGVSPPDSDYPTLHQPEYDFNDDALPTGMEVMTGVALAN